MKRYLILLSLIFLAACAPSPTEALPTLARFPTETESSGVVVLNQTEAAHLRTPLPASFTPADTATPIPASVTVSVTATFTVTPSATITDTPTRTPSALPRLDPNDRPILAFAMTAYASTTLPQNYIVPPYEGVNVTLAPTVNSSGVVVIGAQPTAPSNTTACTTVPTGGFLTIYQSNPDIASLLGCASGTVQTIPAAAQSYQQGMMFWLNGEIVALYNLNDLFQSFPDTFIAGTDPETTSEVPPAGMFAPVRGFLKVWSANPSVRNGLNWATGVEVGATATIQTFANGRMIYISGRTDVIVLIGVQNGQWFSFQGQY